MMRRTTALGATLLALCALCVTCKARKPTEGDLVGDIFIVTRGGQNYKMGLVSVLLFDEDTFSRLMTAKTSKRSEERAKLRPAYDAAMQALRDANREEQLAQAAQEAAHKKVMANLRDDLHDWGGFQKMLAKDESLQKQWYALIGVAGKKEMAVSAARHDLDHVASEYSYCDTCDFLLRDLPHPRATTKSDADGHFVVRLQFARRYGLLARAQRQVIDEVEDYCWALWIAFGQPQRTRLFLSNDNLVQQVSVESAFKAEPTPTPVVRKRAKS